jgi:glutamate decarboxylase
VYPGVGWILWRDQADLPEELIFTVDYLGGEHANFSLNFSRGASQIVAQYYNLIRLGFAGYRDVMSSLQRGARWLAGQIDDLGMFELFGKGDDLPVVCFGLRDGQAWDVFDLSDQLRQRGWIVPAYRMAPNAEDVAVLRVVVREGLSFDMAQQLIEDIGHACEQCTRRAVLRTPGSEHKPAVHAGRGGRRARPGVRPPRETTKSRRVC